MIYLDNSATTKPSDSCISEINRCLKENWGNPSSLHIMGFNAEMAVNEARNKVARLIKARDDEIYFTSGGTESNNTAIFSAAYSKSKQGKKIVTTAIEHPSVLEPMKRLENEGFEIIRLKPSASGKVSIEDIEKTIDAQTVLVSIMLVNNETGATQPVEAAARAIGRNAPYALLHCDAVQGFGKIPIDVSKLGVDLMSISGHKIHGPKGIGVLYKKKSVNLKPLILGGGQEKNLRSGTESVPLIMGLGGATDDLKDVAKNLEKMKELNLAARKILLDTGIVLLNSDDECLPYILNISVPGYRSETLLHFLENKGIYVSSGSACSKGKGSYVLSEMGLDSKRIDSGLRISFSRFNTVCEIEKLAKALIDATAVLRKAK
ncbi:MAG: cysteine desulfurase [Clostridia bacterium]|nr:cysteine desulfurase [Clostridia bacterium]